MGIIELFEIFIYQPLFNALIFIYVYLPWHDLGLAIIALTTLARFLFYPMVAESIRTQKKMNDIQPRLQEIKEKYKNNKEQQALLTMQLFKENKISLFSSFGPLLVQLLIFLGLYRVLYAGINEKTLTVLYSCMPDPGTINQMFLGIINLDEKSIPIALIAGVLQYVQTKMITPPGKSGRQASQQEEMANMMQKYILYIFPLFTVFVLWSLPAALGLYWATSSLFSIVQQYFVLKRLKPASV